VSVGGATFTMNGGRIQGDADESPYTKNTATSGTGAALFVNATNTTAKFGASSTGTVGGTSKNAGDDIVSGGGGTNDTIVATGP
jgi:hypothetical protein